MEIQIDITKITDSPYTPNTKDAFLFEDSDVVEGLINELQTAKPSTFLISGYRGVGKTSFINRIQEKLDSSFINICIGLSKYDGYASLIKKLIRQLYLEYTKEESRKQDSLNDKLGLLYDRTFNEVSFKNSEIHKGIRQLSTDISFNLKKILPIVFLVLSAVNLNIDVLNSDISKYVAFVGTIIWSVLSTWNFKFSFTQEKSKAHEKIRKSLYDDEIAEHHLFEVLDEIKSNNIKVIIVFDELDKISTTEQVEQIISDLKRLLLSGYANFFVVAGQGLYYQLEKSNLVDDPVISSLFSKTLHIPFLRYSALKRYCIRLLKDDNLVSNETVDLYFDSLILDACRIPRKLSNLIRSRLSFKENEVILSIDESLNDKLIYDSKLLEITNKIMDSDLQKITRNNVQLDFFISQIHLWLKRIRDYSSNQFDVEEVVQIENIVSEDYPDFYILQLTSLCELFFDRLIEEKLIKSEVKNDRTYYSWIVEESTESDTASGGTPSGKVDSDFINEFVELEKYIKGIYIDLKEDATWDNTRLSIKHMLDELITMQALSRSRINSNKLNEIIETRNKVLHGLPIKKEEQDIIANSQFDIARLKAELIQEYTLFVSTRFLSSYTVSRENKFGFDFLAKKEKISIVFEVKYLQTEKVETRTIYDILDKFTNYSQISSERCHYVLFFYQLNGRKTFDSFKEKFIDIVNSRMPELNSRFHLYYTSEYRGDASSGRLESYLSQIVEDVENDYKSRERIISGDLFSEEFNDAKLIIQEKAKEEWPDDYDMQLNQIEKQENAIKKLLFPIPDDIPVDVFEGIRAKVKREWPTDFEMRAHEEEKQIESYRKLGRK